MIGAKKIGSAALNAAGVATLKFTPTAASTDTLTASYAGDACDAGSISSQASLTVK
jgi:hypothetical protein